MTVRKMEFEVTGSNFGALEQAAEETILKVGGEGWVIDEIGAEPIAYDSFGNVLAWKADVEAHQP